MTPELRLKSVWAVVPAKGFTRGKSRLHPVLNDESRARFARELFEHVTGELSRTPSIAGVLVLTDDEDVAQLARQSGHQVLRDRETTGLSRIVDAGLQDVQQRGATAALVCMADLPRLRSDEVQQALDGLLQSDVVVVPDLEQAGTNMLCLAPPLAMPSCFGNVDSFQRHVRSAGERGLRVQALHAPSICFDVDGPEDLRAVD